MTFRDWPLAQAQRRSYYWLVVFLLSLCFLVDPAQGQANASITFANLSDAFPQLQGLSSTVSGKPGSLNFTRCCLLAVSESYIIQDGIVTNNPNASQNYIDLSSSDLNASQFPCGAVYNGNSSGAPPVIVPYSWCNQNCAGWERSTNQALSQWVQPFVGFILPAAVFCLNVPQKSTFSIHDGLFQDHYKNLPEKWGDFLGELWAILVFLKLKKKTSQVTNGQSAGVHVHEQKQASFKVLMNLLSLSEYLIFASIFMVARATIAASIALINTMVWVAVVFAVAGPMILSGLYEAALDRKIIHSLRNDLSGKSGGEKDTKGSFPYKKIHQLYAILVGNLILIEDDSSKAPKIRTVWDDVENLVKPKDNRDQQSGQDQPLESTAAFPKYKWVTDTRLKAMLGCQASFGASIGAPVVFFVGSFLFSVISNLSAVGDNDTSHALAFGMWWMTIPHVAIVSGCLLAGNNPNTLEVIACSATDPWPRNLSTNWYRPYYRSIYTPAWMWERGRNKRKWIDKICGIYAEGENSSRSEEFHLTSLDWFTLIIITTFLMVLPFVLAFLTSYYTPTVGLSCRTFTFLLYFVLQVLLSALWAWDFFDPQKLTTQTGWPSAFCLLLCFTLFGSFFTTFVGTFLQILGVYRNCLCTMPINYWLSKDYSFAISSNSALAITLANSYWMPTGVASIVLLIVVCYVGWWYQRHWRLQFGAVVDGLLGDHGIDNSNTNNDGGGSVLVVTTLGDNGLGSASQDVGIDSGQQIKEESRTESVTSPGLG